VAATHKRPQKRFLLLAATPQVSTTAVCMEAKFSHHAWCSESARLPSAKQPCIWVWCSYQWTHRTGVNGAHSDSLRQI
jgi:hypothetical protein